MRLIPIGVSGSFPAPDSPASCYLVEHHGEDRVHRLLLDLGSGALGPLQRHVDLADIDAVLLSHLHPDHCLDMCGFYVVRRYYTRAMAEPVPRVPVYGPPGTAKRLAQAYGLPADPGMTGEFDFHSFPEEPFSIGPWTVSVRRVQHPVPAFAIRLQPADSEGPVLAYSGDTGPCSALVDLAKGADVLLCEASFVASDDNPPGLHLTGRDAAEHATRAGVGRLLLTHVPPRIDPQQVLAEALPFFDGPLELARPGHTYHVGE